MEKRNVMRSIMMKNLTYVQTRLVLEVEHKRTLLNLLSNIGTQEESTLICCSVTGRARIIFLRACIICTDQCSLVDEPFKY